MPLYLKLRAGQGVILRDSQDGNAQIAKISLIERVGDVMEIAFHADKERVKIDRFDSIYGAAGETPVEFIDPLTGQVIGSKVFRDLPNLGDIPFDSLDGHLKGCWCFALLQSSRDRLHFAPGTWVTTRHGAIDRFTDKAEKEGANDRYTYILSKLAQSPSWQDIAISPDGERCGRFRPGQDAVLRADK